MMTVYQVHVASWGQDAMQLASYVKEMGFTHVEFVDEPPRAVVESMRHHGLETRVEGVRDTAWAEETLAYFSEDPFFRKHRHEALVRVIEGSSARVLPLSCDLVMPGKRSLIGRMPGDYWQKFANMRALLALQYATPGSKLLFMGGEFGQWAEWEDEAKLDWPLLDYPAHAQLRLMVGTLNHLVRTHAALREDEFEWVRPDDAERNVLAFVRRAGSQTVLAVCHLSAISRMNYRVGVPVGGLWREMLNSNAQEYGGSGEGNFGGAEALPVPLHGRPYSMTLTLPPLAVLLFEADAG